VSKFTPGPWSLWPASEDEFEIVTLYGGEREPLSIRGHQLAEPDLERIVACLNACETLADPSVIPLLIQIARMAQNREMNDMKLTAMNLLADEAMKKVEGK
jgi:hypothetical protein